VTGPSDDAQGCAEADVSALIRATIFVRDLERSVGFYRALGLTEAYYDGVLDHPSASTLLGFRSHHPYPITILKRPGPNFGMVGLFQLDPAHGAECMVIADGPARIGEIALVFYVANLDRVMPALVDAGARWAPAPQRFEIGQLSAREVCMRDCDGTLLNLVEREPAGQNRTSPDVES
jgi:catechol 2,3-dioxygenase-like lactoylglutathione lyase family enzyme